MKAILRDVGITIAETSDGLLSISKMLEYVEVFEEVEGAVKVYSVWAL